MCLQCAKNEYWRESMSGTSDTDLFKLWRTQRADRSRIPERFRGHDPNLKMLEFLNDIVIKKRENVILWGDVGAGKTHNCCAVLQSWIENHRIASGRYVNVASLSIEVMSQAWNFDPAPYINPSVIILDDLGVERPHDRGQEMLYYIINERYNERRPTIATSNVSADDMAGILKIDDRIVSRLQTGGVWRIPGKDRRKHE